LRYEVETSPAYSVLKVLLENGEGIVAEAGAMMAMKGNIEVQTKTAGGILKGLLRKLAVGETIFLNTFTAREGSGIIWLAPSIPGDITYIQLKGNGLLVQDTGYLAHYGAVDYELNWRGIRGLLAEGNIVWLRLYGDGGVWVNSYGGIICKELGVGETIIVDNNHLVAFDDTVTLNIKKFGGWKSFLFGGEGIVVELKGPGKVYMQTRILPLLAEVINRFLPKK